MLKFSVARGLGVGGVAVRTAENLELRIPGGVKADERIPYEKHTLPSLLFIARFRSSYEKKNATGNIFISWPTIVVSHVRL